MEVWGVFNWRCYTVGGVIQYIYFNFNGYLDVGLCGCLPCCFCDCPHSFLCGYLLVVFLAVFVVV